MKKLFFVLLTAFLISSCTQAQSQSDFYGKWIEESRGSMEYEISAATFTSIWLERDRNTFEIFSWEKITNENEDTKGEYPTGYLIGLRHGLGNTTARLFMHRDKNSLINAYEKRGVLQQEAYIKSSSQINAPDDIPSNRNITFFEVNNNPSIYHNNIITWSGMATNLIETNSSTTFDFLVGYDRHHALEGIVPVVFYKKISIDHERPFELVGFISVNENDYSFYIEGSRIKQ